MQSKAPITSKTWQGIENCQICILSVGFVYAPLLIVAAAAALLF